ARRNPGRSSAVGLTAQPAGPPPGQRLCSGALIGQGERSRNKIRITKVSTDLGEPRYETRPSGARRCRAGNDGRGWWTGSLPDVGAGARWYGERLSPRR